MAVDGQFYVALPTVASLYAIVIKRLKPQRCCAAVTAVSASIAGVAVLVRFVVVTIRRERAGSFAQQIVYLKELFRK